ncbi:uncharacterized protein LOC118189056 [Stegodyphus dumicola]|uniref:uncharacterized protein LOC118189056 n=1 Tax=Stegodyphus dumicola TaxID=202533 RepID=UPI0015B095E7|nr:uncharacterized protein LOC118189056 [Stegodyphus dumicola]
MWACAASNTYKWGPDLTSELPPHLLQEALFPKQTKHFEFKAPVPSAPSELPCDPLLNNEQPMGMSSPPPKYYQPVVMNMNTAVRVLPTNSVQQHKVRPLFCTFSTAEPV